MHLPPLEMALHLGRNDEPAAFARLLRAMELKPDDAGAFDVTEAGDACQRYAVANPFYKNTFRESTDNRVRQLIDEERSAASRRLSDLNAAEAKARQSRLDKSKEYRELSKKIGILAEMSNDASRAFREYTDPKVLLEREMRQCHATLQLAVKERESLEAKLLADHAASTVPLAAVA